MWKSKEINHRPELAEARKILEELCGYINRYTSSTWPVVDEISMSINAIGFILNEAINDIHYGPSSRWHALADPTMKIRLLESDWCPLDVERLCSDVAIDGHYYLTLKDGPYGGGPKDKHRKCTETSCHAATVNEATYVTRHVRAGCMCDHYMAPEEVVQVIEGDGIPVLCWKKAAGEPPRLVVEDTVAHKIPYIAISHV